MWGGAINRVGVWGCLMHCSYAILCHQPHLEFCKTKSIIHSGSTSVSSLHPLSEPVNPFCLQSPAHSLIECDPHRDLQRLERQFIFPGHYLKRDLLAMD